MLIEIFLICFHVSFVGKVLLGHSKYFFSIGGHSGISCLRELVCVVMNDTICKSKSNSKPTCGHAKTYGSMIHWHVLLTLQMSETSKLAHKKIHQRSGHNGLLYSPLLLVVSMEEDEGYLGRNVAWRSGP
jgi:hypothetical protein